MGPCVRERALEAVGHRPVVRAVDVTPGPGLASVAGNAAIGRLLRRLATADSGREAPPGFAASVQSFGDGRAIPGGVLRSLEAGLGVPLGGVRMHVGSQAAALSAQLDALAFTVGQDVFFGAGSYDPDSSHGYHVLAHEVVHTLQPGTGSAGTLTVGAADSPAEREAEAIATWLTARRRSGSDEPVDGLTGLIMPANATAGRMIRRFGRQEHQEIGDATHATVDLGGGLVLTWGEIVGLAGDEFDSVAGLQAAASTSAGRAEIRRILASEANHSTQYVELAMRNVMHFAGGGTAIPTWETHHESALLTALLAGLHDDESEWQQAQLIEAFGQHFLTDSFSAGHIRTPRAEIIAWYQNDFAPRAVPPLIAQMRTRLRTELVRQLGPQMVAPNFVIEAAVDTIMGGALAWFADEIRNEFQPLFGLGVSGAISGALHDRDNERGLWVASEAHPEPWLAYGDGRLRCSPTSADQAQLAVLTAREQLVAARALGRIRREQNGTTPATPSNRLSRRTSTIDRRYGRIRNQSTRPTHLPSQRRRPGRPGLGTTNPRRAIPRSALPGNRTIRSA